MNTKEQLKAQREIHDSECFTVAVQVMCAAIDAAKEGE